MKNLCGMKIIMIAALALMILADTGAATSLSNSGGGMWKYQREISIKENSGTALTDYQVLIELKGADFPGEAKNDGADVRFTDSNGNELNYWIESWDYAGKSAKVWVKVPSIPAGSSTVIRMNYGNPSAGAVSEGDKVFEFFDDFDKESLDVNKWQIDSNPIISFSNSILTLKSSYSTSQLGYIKTLNSFESPIIIRYKWNAAEPSSWYGGYLGIGDFTNDQYSSVGYVYWKEYESALYSGSNRYPPRVGTGESTEGYIIPAPSIGMWYTSDFIVGDKSLTEVRNGNIYGPANYLGYSGNIYIGIFAPAYAYDYTILKVDYIAARKYASPEPTVTLAPPPKSSSPYSLRQFQETTIKVTIENSGTSEIKAIEIMDSIHPSFDLTGGDFPNPKKFDIIRAGESRELQYTIRSKESGAFTLDPSTVTYADSEGNIQEVKSEPVSIKVVPSSDDGTIANSGQYSKSASVSLHGEKTDVVMGEDILLRLSAVNLITKPRMHVQVIIIPPSGMSVTSSEFSKSAAGQFTANYQLEPGDGKDIEVRIRSNQIGDFNVNGRIIYYFGDEKDKAEDQTLNLPIKVRKEISSTPVQNPAAAPAHKSTSGFGVIISISALLFITLLRKRR